ncbi:MAG: hypothetical protein LBL24_11275 [Bacteroidales bacterium]|jgi:hypothetical protein|nr:hypothetical protein [Bacteroidales bacterium]
MKSICLFAKAGLLMACIGWMLVSCEKSKEITVSSENLLIEAFPEEQPTIDISTTVSWTATVEQGVDWLEVNPTYGKGNATITLTVGNNSAFSRRAAWIAISGDGVQTDTVKVVQEAGVDVAEKIEDETFRTFCLDNYDQSPRDGKLSLTEVQGVTILNLSKKNLRSLAGIEYFTKLKQLKCNDNKLEYLDLGKNKELTVLECFYNELTTLNVSENTKLTDLNCMGNLLTSLDVTQNTALTWIFCSINRITSIDVSNNTALTVFECDQNELASLDVSRNIKLGRLSCGANRLSSLDVRNNTMILQLWCGENPFTDINLSQNKDLQMLYCNNSKLTSLNLSNNTALLKLVCSGSKQLTSLNLTANIHLTELSCAGSALSGSIDLSRNTKLTRFDLDYNKLEIIYVWPQFEEDEINYKKDAATRYVIK